MAIVATQVVVVVVVVQSIGVAFRFFKTIPTWSHLLLFYDLRTTRLCLLLAKNEWFSTEHDVSRQRHGADDGRERQDAVHDVGGGRRDPPAEYVDTSRFRRVHLERCRWSAVGTGTVLVQGGGGRG